MARSNGMGFWRRMNWGQHRDAWKSGEIRQLKKREVEQEVQDELSPPLIRGTVAERIPMTDGRTLLVHAESLCANDATCCIHKPSNHPMLAFSQQWREDAGLMERVCAHGVGHPDPDDLAFKKSQYGDNYNKYAFGVHGCDGCCAGSY